MIMDDLIKNVSPTNLKSLWSVDLMSIFRVSMKLRFWMISIFQDQFHHKCYITDTIYSWHDFYFERRYEILVLVSTVLSSFVREIVLIDRAVAKRRALLTPHSRGAPSQGGAKSIQNVGHFLKNLTKVLAKSAFCARNVICVRFLPRF